MQKIKTLLILEKSSQYSRISKTEEYKNLEKTMDFTVHYCHSVVPSYLFDYPKNIKYKSLPLIENYNFKLDKNLMENLSEKEIEKYKKEKNKNYLSSVLNLNKDFFSSFDQLIVRTDPDHTGCFAMYNEMIMILGENWMKYFKKIKFIYMGKMFHEDLNKELKSVFENQKKSNKRLKQMFKFIEYGKVKRYFEYNYQLNSNILIKELYKHHFLDNYKSNKEFEDIYTKYSFSKYTLLLLLVINQKDEELKKDNKKYHFKDIDMINLLTKHEGTGKYVTKYNYGMGTPASISNISNNLVELKLFDVIMKKIKIKTPIAKINSSEELREYNKLIKNGNNKHLYKYEEKEVERYVLSKKSKLFIKNITKKMFDPDLVYRLNNWCEEGLGTSKPKIDRYLKEIYTKQKIINKRIKESIV